MEGIENTRKIHKRSFIPLKVCGKKNPASIAILYNLTSENKKRYIHEIPLPMLSPDETADNLYSILIKSEPIYLNPKIVPKKQIVRIIENIMKKPDGKNSASKNSNDKISLKNELQNELANHNDQYESDISEDDKGEDKEPEIYYENLNDGSKRKEVPENFQRVFLEDLGKEVMMDEKGNLFDFDGNLLGQAESDDEELKNGDDNYFEDDEDLP